MLTVIIASHGDFAPGMLDSASMLTNNIAGFKVLTLEHNESPDDFYQKTKSLLEESEENILGLVDILGGTPCNTILRAAEDLNKNIRLITAINLPMILHIINNADENIELNDLANQLCEIGKEQIKLLG